MKKIFIAVVVSGLFISPWFVIAQTASSSLAVKKTVTFRVEVGDVVCKNNVGTASVLFLAEPKAGGYFEIIGGTIDENRMTLDHRVALISGTYTWKGVVNTDYQEVPPSIGQFTIAACDTVPTTTSPKPTPVPATPPQKKDSITEKPIQLELKENVIKEVVDSMATTTATSSDTKENAPLETKNSDNAKTIIFVVIVVSLGVVLFVLKKRKEAGKK
jgi:hypothetical protein